MKKNCCKILLIISIIWLNSIPNIFAKCTHLVKKGVIVRNEHIKNGEIQEIYDGGKAFGTIIEKGGTQHIYRNGQAINTIINSDGLQITFDKSKVENITLNGGSQLIFGGKVQNTTIKNKGAQVLFNGQAINTTIESGLQLVNNGTSKNTKINTINAEQILLVNGIAKNTTIQNNGKQNLEGNSCIANHTIITNNGLQKLYQGKSINNKVKDNGIISLIDQDYHTIYLDINVSKIPNSKQPLINKQLKNTLVQSKGIVKIAKNYKTQETKIKNLKIKHNGILKQT
jgi:autotransporter passenger strand-loop-strand repeat protein